MANAEKAPRFKKQAWQAEAIGMAQPSLLQHTAKTQQNCYAILLQADSATSTAVTVTAVATVIPLDSQ